MAEELAEDAADRSSYDDFTFKSAGTFACEGEPATPEAIQAMEEVDLNIDRHRAQQFDKELAEWADVILAMEANHIEAMEAMAPDEESKMHTLLGFAAGVDGYPGESSYDVRDPYQEDIEEYRAARDQIAEAVEKALARLVREQEEAEER
jgi:protein-tyrosine-phosphatase